MLPQSQTGLSKRHTMALAFTLAMGWAMPQARADTVCKVLGQYGDGVYKLLEAGPNGANAVKRSLPDSQAALGKHLAQPPKQLVGLDGSVHPTLDASAWRGLEPPLKLAIWERYCSHIGEPWSQGATYAMRFILDASTRQGYDRAAAKSGQGRVPGPSAQG